MEWRPATIETVSKIVERDLKACDEARTAAFTTYKVGPYRAPIVRYGKVESVVVVARRHDEVIYWKDVEEGFNRSPVDSNGLILEHTCNQDDLCIALIAWTSQDRDTSSGVSLLRTYLL